MPSDTEQVLLVEVPIGREAHHVIEPLSALELFRDRLAERLLVAFEVAVSQRLFECRAEADRKYQVQVTSIDQ